MNWIEKAALWFMAFETIFWGSAIHLFHTIKFMFIGDWQWVQDKENLVMLVLSFPGILLAWYCFVKFLKSLDVHLKNGWGDKSGNNE